MIETYGNAIKYIYDQLPVFHRIGAAAYKNNLDNTIALSKVLGNPELKFPAIHVAGTNGKGSVSHMIASVLQESGLKTGLFTSPHLKDFRERIRVNGEMIPKTEMINFINEYQKEIDEICPSFFELTFAIAMHYFASQKVDIAIVEVGMGGRLDSTNIVNPILSIITNISLDHQQFLGDTLTKIAGEKAGIIKHKVPVLIGKSQAETDQVFIDAAEKNESEIYFADKIYSAQDFHFSYTKPYGTIFTMVKNNTIFFKDLYCSLSGDYQKENLQTAFTAIDILNKQGYDIERPVLHDGISNVSLNTGLKGRWQVFSRDPLTICDIAHNEAGIKSVLEQISHLHVDKLHFVFGVVNDKDYTKILSLLPSKATYYFCKANIPRGLDATVLAEEALKFKLKGKVYPSVKLAYREAKAKSKDNDLIFITGSAFVVAEVDRYRSLKKR